MAEKSRKRGESWVDDLRRFLREQEELQVHLHAYREAVGPQLGLSETELLQQVRESTRKATRKKS